MSGFPQQAGTLSRHLHSTEEQSRDHGLAAVISGIHLTGVHIDRHQGREAADVGSFREALLASGATGAQVSSVPGSITAGGAKQRRRRDEGIPPPDAHTVRQRRWVCPRSHKKCRNKGLAHKKVTSESSGAIIVPVLSQRLK